MDATVNAAPDPARFLLLSGLLTLPFQFIQFGPAQLSQLWALLALVLVIQQGMLKPRLVEVLCYVFFLAVALSLTYASGYERVKAIEQVIKFAVVYPAFYLVGRALGDHYRIRILPFGYIFLWVLLAFEFGTQYFQLPYIHQHVPFMQGALHGTFKERNWLAIFFFLCGYLLFLQSERGQRSAALFVALCVAVALLSESKTILIPCGVVLLLHFRGSGLLKALAIGAGAALFCYRFGAELSGDQLRVRLEDERGLAFTQAMDLISRDPLGYGFGFVESHFSSSWIAVKGLGAGTNSIFSSPLDLFLMAGVAGLGMWLVIFAGVGLGKRVMALLAPIGLWSLVNPLHQSEIVYLFLGLLVSFGLAGRAEQQGVSVGQREPRVGGVT